MRIARISESVISFSKLAIQYTQLLTKLCTKLLLAV